MGIQEGVFGSRGDLKLFLDESQTFTFPSHVYLCASTQRHETLIHGWKLAGYVMPKLTGNLTGTAFGAYIRKVNVFGRIREMETSIKFWLKKKQQKQLTLNPNRMFPIQHKFFTASEI